MVYKSINDTTYNTGNNKLQDMLDQVIPENQNPKSAKGAIRGQMNDNIYVELDPYDTNGKRA